MLASTTRVFVPALPSPFACILADTDEGKRLMDQFGDDYFNAELVLAAWTAMLGDSPLERGSKPQCVVKRFFRRTANDLRGMIKAYAELGHLLMKSRNALYGPNKPFLIEFARTPVFREYKAFYEDPSDSSLFQYLLSFCFFGKKAYFKGDKDLEATALRKWVEVEEKLSNLQLPLGTLNLRAVLAWIFRDWSPDQFLPVHGPGAVAEVRVKGVVSKNVRMALTKVQQYLYTRVRPNTVNNGWGKVAIYRPFNEVLPRQNIPNRKVVQEAARLIFVPKDYKSCRSICMEPAGTQWVQQGIRLNLEAFIRRSVLGLHVDLARQDKNRDAARTGSYTRRYDTIDLSSASDSVAWKLILKSFPYKVVKHLAASRTATIKLPRGSKTVSVFKFAPMGSALCFPVQCIVYSAIAIMVGIAEAYRLDWNDDDMRDLDFDRAYCYAFGKPGSRKGRFQSFLAYGDDIITDYRMTSNTIEALQLFGFTVNVDKSFTGPDECRESCGGYYLNGSDVTPYTFKPKQLGPEDCIESTAGLIDQTNLAKKMGFLSLRRNLISYILHKPIQGVKQDAKGRNPILFSTDPEDSMAIQVEVADNSHLRRRAWIEGVITPDMPTFKTIDDYRSCSRLSRGDCTESVAYQLDMVESISMGPSEKREWSSADDFYRYTQWWRSRYNGGGNEYLSSSPVAADVLGTDVTWRWTATYA